MGALLFHQDGSKTYMNNPTYRSPQEPVYAETDPQYQTVAFVPGVSNPLYEWYQPDMTRAECTERLTEATPGTFCPRLQGHPRLAHDWRPHRERCRAREDQAQRRWHIRATPSIQCSPARVPRRANPCFALPEP